VFATASASWISEPVVIADVCYRAQECGLVEDRGKDVTRSSCACLSASSSFTLAVVASDSALLAAISSAAASFSAILFSSSEALRQELFLVPIPL